jgi:hypothetical protein
LDQLFQLEQNNLFVARRSRNWRHGREKKSITRRGGDAGPEGQRAAKTKGLDEELAFDLDDAAVDVVQNLIGMIEVTLDHLEVALRLARPEHARDAL